MATPKVVSPAAFIPRAPDGTGKPGTGNWPGVTNNGVWLPLKVDNITYKSISLANSNTLPQSKGVLNASGKAVSGFRLNKAMGSAWVGRQMNVAYIVYQGPGFTPISYASMPVTILFIP